MKKSFILTVLVNMMILTIASAETVLYGSFFLSSENNQKSILLYEHSLNLQNYSYSKRFSLDNGDDLGNGTKFIFVINTQEYSNKNKVLIKSITSVGLLINPVGVVFIPLTAGKDSKDEGRRSSICFDNSDNKTIFELNWGFKDIKNTDKTLSEN